MIVWQLVLTVVQELNEKRGVRSHNPSSTVRHVWADQKKWRAFIRDRALSDVTDSVVWFNQKSHETIYIYEIVQSQHRSDWAQVQLSENLHQAIA